MSMTGSAGVGVIPDPPLRLRTKLAFGMGSAAETIALFSLGSYALLFYNQVLGLPAWMAGMALSISLLFDGFSDPIIGSLSDRTKSRLGRRHPYMFAAPIPIGLCFFAIFNPPSGLSQGPLFIWFTGSVTGLRIAMGFFHTPHLALGGELSHDYTERSQVMAWNNFATWVGGSAISLIALTFFFKATPEYPRGLLNPAPYFPFAAFAAISAVLILLASAWFTRDQIARLPQPPKDQVAFSPFEFMKDVTKVLSNRNYLWLLIAYFFLSLMTGIRDSLGLYMGTYYWGFTSEQLRFYTIGSFVGFLAALYFTPRFHALWDKKSIIIASAIGLTILPSSGVILRMMGLMYQNGHSLLLPVQIALSSVNYATGAILSISVMSALADVADQNEVSFGVRQEGLLYSTRALFSKIDTAIGAALAGIVLTLISFPEHARPDTIDPEVLTRLGWVNGPLAILPGLVAVIFYMKYSITKADHAATRAEISRQRSLALEVELPAGQ